MLNLVLRIQLNINWQLTALSRAHTTTPHYCAINAWHWQMCYVVRK